MLDGATVWTALMAMAMTLGVAGAVSGETVLQTTTTQFAYNADGAPVAVSNQTGSEPTTTTYLSWDNYQNGRVRAANGNLLGYGPSADGGVLSAQFTYDARDRLVGVATAGQSVDYAYHAASLLASSTLGSSGDTLQFYYGNGSAPQVSSMYHPTSGRWASFLGPVRYLSDGTEQTLLAPRKDTAGVYQAQGETLTPYQYDAYGARVDAAGACSSADQYDLADNPFQYTGEYRDPTWCGTYLRARWYLPTLHTFLQRDAVDRVQRYGAVGGNPIMRRDPTGLSWRGAAGAFNKFASSGWGNALSVLPYVGEAMFAGDIMFNAGSFFHNARNAEMLGYGLAAGVIAGGRDFGVGAQVDRAAGFKIGFSSRIATDLAIGAGGSALAATDGKHRRFDTKTFLVNLGYSAAGIYTARSYGIGYRPFALNAEDVDRQWTSLIREPKDTGSVLVYRMKQRMPLSPLGKMLFDNKPLVDACRWGPYHEAIIGVTHDELWQTEVGGFTLKRSDEAEMVTKRTVVTNTQFTNIWVSPSITLPNIDDKFSFVGVYPRDKVYPIFQNGEGRGIPTLAEQERKFALGEHSRTQYSRYRNNCQTYANSIVAQVQAVK